MARPDAALSILASDPGSHSGHGFRQFSSTALPFNVHDFGAKGDGATIDRQAIGSAIVELNAAGGGRLFFPPGIYLIDDALPEITVPCVVSGAGIESTISCSADVDILTLSGLHSRVQSIRLVRTGAVSGGAGLRLSGGYQVIDNVRISSCFYGIQSDDDAWGWTVRDSYIVDFKDVGIFVSASSANLDRGDQAVVGVTCDSSVAQSGSACIRIQAHGGLKVTTCKLLRADYGIDLSVIDGAATSILLVTDTSIEIPTVNCVRLQRAGATGSYQKIVISGGQMFVGSGLTAVSVGGGTTDIVLGGGLILTGSGAGSIGIDIAGGDIRRVDGCTLTTFETGIRINNLATNVSIGKNSYPDVDTPIEDNTTTTNAKQRYIDHHYRRQVTGITSTVSYTNIFEIVMGTNRGCRIELVGGFLLQGIGGAARSIGKLFHRLAANCVETAITDTAGGSVFDVQFDVATTSGSILIGVKRNAGAGGTQLDGSLTLIVDGYATKVRIL